MRFPGRGAACSVVNQLMHMIPVCREFHEVCKITSRNIACSSAENIKEVDDRLRSWMIGEKLWMTQANSIAFLDLFVQRNWVSSWCTSNS